MTDYFCISITFLDITFHGKSDNDEPEWPPSPMRLFQALIAGARIGSRVDHWSESKEKAFQWLESLEPPIIVAPEAKIGMEYDISVPNNDADSAAKFWARGIEPPSNKRLSSLRTTKSVSPMLLNGDTIHYLWKLNSEENVLHHVRILCEDALHILSLGWGIDQVVARGTIIDESEAAALPGKHWRPFKNVFIPGGVMINVPISGSLLDLEKVHLSFVNRLKRGVFCQPIRPSKFNKIVYSSSISLPPRSYAAFELPEGISFRQEIIAIVAAMIRSAACVQARSSVHDFPGDAETYVAGHVGTTDSTPPRFSYLPLPSIGGKNADGMIRRIIVAEPFGRDGTHARWAQQHLLGTKLIDNDGNERGMLLNLWRKTSKPMIGRYTSESTEWCTITPVFLPGFDGRSYLKAKKLFFVAVRQAGLPLEIVSDIELRKAPLFHGSQHPSKYFLPDYIRAKRCPGWHVELKFREPVRGPISIGAGRHIGLGIFTHLDN